MHARTTALIALSMVLFGSPAQPDQQKAPHKTVSKEALVRQLGMQIKALWDKQVEPAIKDVMAQNPELTTRPIQSLLVFIPDTGVWPWNAEIVGPDPITPNDHEIYLIRRKRNEYAGNPVRSWAVIRDRAGNWSVFEVSIPIRHGVGEFEVNLDKTLSRRELLGLINKFPIPVPGKIQVMAYPYLPPDAVPGEEG